jgi:uncharacterized protein YutE (UPF0331/DUF86 family)
VVDVTRLRRLLQNVTDELAYLRAERASADRIEADERRLRALKYAWVVAIEGCIDVAHHVCATEGWGPPESNADTMGVLGRHGVLSVEAAAGMASAVGFRNVLVHRYAEVDNARVVAFLSQLALLEEFVAALSRLVASPE